MAAIDIELLRTEINRLLDLFVAKGVTSVELKNDAYWSFGWEEQYVRHGADHPEAMVGSLFDDLEFLAKGSHDDAVAMMLCHAAPLLNYLGVRAGDVGVFQGAAAIGAEPHE